MNEKEKQKQGLEFWNNDPEIKEAKLKSRLICQKINTTSVDETETIHSLVNELFAECGTGLTLKPPINCDFGYNIYVGENVLINYQCVFLDAAPVKIGDNCFIGPMTGFYTVNHPEDPERRNDGYVYGEPITLEENVWIGGGCTILSGVTIGKNSIIGAGSVVTKDIPANVVAAGNPARVIRAVKK